jgi:ketosteroid isomerase-like protein
VSQENVERFRKALGGYNRRDIGPTLEIADPDCEWHPFTAAVEGDKPYLGHEGLRQWWANVDATFERVNATADDVRDLGDVLLVLGRLQARFTSGVTLESEIAWLLRYRNDLVVSGHTYQSHAEALAAAGLSE